MSAPGRAPSAAVQEMSGHGWPRSIGRASQAMSDPWRLAGQRAIVTGASSGIGRATAIGLASAGCRVAALARTADALDRLVAELGEDRCIPIAVDLSDPAATSSSVAAAIRLLDGVDIVVNNAGVGYRATVEETTLEQWDNTFAVNVRAAFLVAQACLPAMLDQAHGVFVNVASVGGLIGIPSRAAYGASKAGADRADPEPGRRLRGAGHPRELRGTRHHGDPVGRPDRRGGSGSDRVATRDGAAPDRRSAWDGGRNRRRHPVSGLPAGSVLPWIRRRRRRRLQRSLRCHAARSPGIPARRWSRLSRGSPRGGWRS